MKHIILSLLLLLACSMELRAQATESLFASATIEQQVKTHCGLPASAQLTPTQLDTITVLDLSHLGLEELHDLLVMPRLRWLDLSDNKLEVVTNLNRLDSLRYLNLRHNQLTDISLLAFSQSPSLTIDVTLNYIRSFDFFAGLTQCEFSIIGTALQLTKPDTRLQVYRLYTRINDEGLPQVNVHAESDSENGMTLQYGEGSCAIASDEAKTVSLHAMPRTLTPVWLSADGVTDTTYIVPPMVQLCPAGETRVISLGLPASFQISAITVDQGEVSYDHDTTPAGNEGCSFTYTAPASYEGQDEVYLSFSHHGQLRGYATIRIANGLLGDVNLDGKVDDHDIFALIEHLMNRTPASFSTLAADYSGDGRVSVADVTALIGKLHK